MEQIHLLTEEELSVVIATFAEMDKGISSGDEIRACILYEKACPYEKEVIDSHSKGNTLSNTIEQCYMEEITCNCCGEIFYELNYEETCTECGSDDNTVIFNCGVKASS